MTNEERVFDLFFSQYPELKADRRYLAMNLYCDIMDQRKEEKEKIIAISDLPHDLLKIGYQLPTSWQLKEGTK